MWQGQRSTLLQYVLGLWKLRNNMPICCLFTWTKWPCWQVCYSEAERKEKGYVDKYIHRCTCLLANMYLLEHSHNGLNVRKYLYRSLVSVQRAAGCRVWKYNSLICHSIHCYAHHGRCRSMHPVVARYMHCILYLKLAIILNRTRMPYAFILQK